MTQAPEGRQCRRGTDIDRAGGHRVKGAARTTIEGVNDVFDVIGGDLGVDQAI